MPSSSENEDSEILSTIDPNEFLANAAKTKTEKLRQERLQMEASSVPIQESPKSDTLRFSTTAEMNDAEIWGDKVNGLEEYTGPGSVDDDAFSTPNELPLSYVVEEENISSTQPPLVLPSSLECLADTAVKTRGSKAGKKQDKKKLPTVVVEPPALPPPRILSPKNGKQSTISTTVPKIQRWEYCRFAGCIEKARLHSLCRKHGGLRICSVPGCEKHVQSRNLCIRHGGGSRCKAPGCTSASQSKGRCKRHGGGKFCAFEGCRKKAHLRQRCREHGGGSRCSIYDCVRWSQKEGLCMAHWKRANGEPK